MKRFWNKALTVALITTMGLSVFAGCGTAEKTEPNNTEGKKLQVYTSFTQCMILQVKLPATR